MYRHQFMSLTPFPEKSCWILKQPLAPAFPAYLERKSCQIRKVTVVCQSQSGCVKASLCSVTHALAHHVDDVLVGCRFSMSPNGSLVAAAEMCSVFAAFFFCSFSNFLHCSAKAKACGFGLSFLFRGIAFSRTRWGRLEHSRTHL